MMIVPTQEANVNIQIVNIERDWQRTRIFLTTLLVVCIVLLLISFPGLIFGEQLGLPKWVMKILVAAFLTQGGIVSVTFCAFLLAPSRTTFTADGKRFTFVKLGNTIAAVPLYFFGQWLWFEPIMEFTFLTSLIGGRWKLRITFVNFTPDAAILFHVWEQGLMNRSLPCDSDGRPTLPLVPPNAPFYVTLERKKIAAS